MAQELKNGDAVDWNSHSGKAGGKVVRKITSPVQTKGREAAASQDNPEFIVETEEGRRAAHKIVAIDAG